MKKIGMVLLYIVYGLLLLWPMLVMISYALFTSGIREIFCVTVIGADTAIGAFLLIRHYLRRKEIKKWASITGWILLGLTYAGYLTSVLYFYVFQK